MLTDRKFRVARLWSNQVLRMLAPHFRGSVVNVSAWQDADKDGHYYRSYFTSASDYSTTNFRGVSGLSDAPDAIELDLTAPLPAELRRQFDVVYNHTTLEHVFDVFTAFRNICELSRDVVIIVVPFCQVQHEAGDWGDYWRFTPTCLRRLFQDNGLQVVFEAESPNKDAAVYLLFVAARHPDRWADLPSWNPITAAGAWIGASRLRVAVEVVDRAIRRLAGRK